MPIMAWSCEGMVKNLEKNVKIIGTFIKSDYGVSRQLFLIPRKLLKYKVSLPVFYLDFWTLNKLKYVKFI